MRELVLDDLAQADFTEEEWLAMTPDDQYVKAYRLEFWRDCAGRWHEEVMDYGGGCHVLWVRDDSGVYTHWSEFDREIRCAQCHGLLELDDDRVEHDQGEFFGPGCRELTRRDSKLTARQALIAAAETVSALHPEFHKDPLAKGVWRILFAPCRALHKEGNE